MTADTLVSHLGQVEARAIRLLVAGDRVRDVAAVTGLPVEHVARLLAETPGITDTPRQIPNGTCLCNTPRCGQPRKGRPPLGWVKVTVSGCGDALWHCGWTCARRYIERHEATA